MWAHNERNVSERGMFVSSVSIITLDPELAPLVNYHDCGDDGASVHAAVEHGVCHYLIDP